MLDVMIISPVEHENIITVPCVIDFGEMNENGMF